MIFQRSPVSADVRRALGIDKRERVIAWGIGDASNPDGSLVVATSEALYDQRSGSRYPWQGVIKGTWEEPEFVLTTTGSTGVTRTRIRLDEPRDVPAAVRDRVTDTVVVSQYVELGEGAGAQFVARRDPDGDVANIRWSVVFDAGLDPSDHDLRAAADTVLERLRSSLGI